MFSDTDLRHIIHHFAPPKDQSATVSSLVFSSDGQTLLTFQHLKGEFKNYVAEETDRILVSTLASNLDVDEDTVFQLVDSDPSLALLGLNKKHVITTHERNTLHATLGSALRDRPVSKVDFASEKGLSTKTVDILLSNPGQQLIYSDDWVWSQSYENDVSEVIFNLLRRSLEKLDAVDIVPEDLPGGPPAWFAVRTLNQVLDSHDFAQQFHVQNDQDNIHCVPKQVVERKREATLNELQAGALAYISLQEFWKDFPELYPSFNSVRQDFEKLSYVEIIDVFIVSNSWTSRFVKDCNEAIQSDGLVNITQLGTILPTSLRERITKRVADSVLNTFDDQPVLIGEYILTASRRNAENEAISKYVNTEAAAQWQQLAGNSDQDIKFQLSKISEAIPTSQSVQKALLQDRSAQKAIEESFWAAVSQHEAQNEADFAIYWIERVVSRCRIYSEGLTTVEDQKLRDQLTELLATHVHKELVPDAIAKAKTQGLVLSRKTRKNLQKLETKMSSVDKMDLPGMVTTLDRFNTKQALEPASLSVLEESKQAMIQDMHRRMHKQKKGDGPALFLTLVILLFANRNPGIVYATGKFAPKLLKQLKGVMEENDYEKLERWKEAAKTSELSVDDRDEIKNMAGV